MLTVGSALKLSQQQTRTHRSKHLQALSAHTPTLDACSYLRTACSLPAPFSVLRCEVLLMPLLRLHILAENFRLVSTRGCK